MAGAPSSPTTSLETTHTNGVSYVFAWWDCVKNDMENMGSLGLSQKDAQSRNKWRRRINGATA